MADVVSEGPIPDALRQNMEAWVGCIAGALDNDTYTALLADAGFLNVGIEVTRRYSVAEAGIDTTTLPSGWEEADGKIVSAFIRAAKPGSSDTLPVQGVPLDTSEGRCCDPGCCQ